MPVSATLTVRTLASIRLFRLLAVLISIGMMPIVAAQTHTQDRLMIHIADSVIEITVEPAEFAVSGADIQQWIDQAVHAVAAFYQGFPVTKLHVMVSPGSGDHISGVTYRGSEPLIVLTLGIGVTRTDLARDWVVTHEMVHLAFPPVQRRHHWIEEGLATYVEPLARNRAGLLSEEEVWRWFVDGVPKGLPQTGDKGLDHTPTWGRTYWGGALFCLLADIEIRRRTANRFALEDALRAIVAAGGTMQQADELWPLTKVFEAADRAIGVPVLMELYEKMKADPADLDLDQLWQRLGVHRNGDRLEFDDSATLALVRRALLSGSSE
jgi:hypothetical protein